MTDSTTANKKNRPGVTKGHRPSIVWPSAICFYCMAQNHMLQNHMAQNHMLQNHMLQNHMLQKHMLDVYAPSLFTHPSVPPSLRPSVPPSLRPCLPPSLPPCLPGKGNEKGKRKRKGTSVLAGNMAGLPADSHVIKYYKDGDFG